MYEKKEFFPIVNQQGEVVGCASRKECHKGSFLLHPVVHLHVFNLQGYLLLQKRSKNKDIQPNKWDTSVGGHIEYGEKKEEALLREAEEELNLTNFMPEFIQSYVFESECEREKIYSYRTICHQSLRFNQQEIDEIRFWNTNEIRQNIGKKVFTPNFEYEFSLLFCSKRGNNLFLYT